MQLINWEGRSLPPPDHRRQPLQLVIDNLMLRGDPRPQPILGGVTRILGQRLASDICLVDGAVGTMDLALALRAVGYTPALHLRELERTGRQYQDGASPSRLRTQRVPALPAQRQVHGLQPHEAVDAVPERRTGDLEARVRFQTVCIGNDCEPSHNLARGGSVYLHSPARLLSVAAAGFMPRREAVG